MTGRPDGQNFDGSLKCEQAVLIEGPGLMGWTRIESGWTYADGKWAIYRSSKCLILEEKYPLKVFTTEDLSDRRETSLDGVIRNIVFTNTDSKSTISTFCKSESFASQTTSATLK